MRSDERGQRVNVANLSRLVEVISDLGHQGYKVVLVSSGAVGMGCRELGLAKKPTDPQMKRAVAGVGQSRIMRMYSELFETVGLKIAQLLVSQRDFLEQQRWAEIRDTIAACLDAGVVPIINENDTTNTDGVRFGDNDNLAALTAVQLEAEGVFLFTDVDYLYTANPNVDPSAEPMRVVSEAFELNVDTREPGSSLGTGGMSTKVAAARTAHCAGIPCGILHGKHPERIFSFLSHDETASTHSGRSPLESDTLSDQLVETEPEGTLFAAEEGEQLSEAERWILSLPVVGDVDLSDPNSQNADLRDFVLDAVQGGLGGLKSLSGTAHHGGVRVFNRNVEIARARVSFDEDGACTLPSLLPEESVVLTPGLFEGKKDNSLGLDPARYDPKVPKAYDHGLPKKHVPFTCGSSRFDHQGKKDYRPGPGDYNAAKQTLAGALTVSAAKTMGVAPAEQRLLFKSTSAPSIPRDHQCFGYDEAGDGRLIRQGRKDGIQELSGKPGDSAGPGHYDVAQARSMANAARGGRIMPPAYEAPGKATETPGPGHYVAKAFGKESEKPIYSSFASQTERDAKPEKKGVEMPGPGQYYSSRPFKRPNMREMHPELQYFGSTSERFPEGEAVILASQTPGPGQYGLVDYRKKAAKSFAWLNGKRFQDHAQNAKKVTSPGPGAYDPTSSDGRTSGRTGTVSILGSTGSLAFGSMEARRGIADTKKGQDPGPGAYYEGVPGEDSRGSADQGREPRRPRKVFPPSSFFRSTVPKDIMVAQYQKDGQVGPPPGAYSPKSLKAIGNVQHVVSKGEGFGSSAQRSSSMPPGFTSPGPGWYKVSDVTGGKVKGTFNRVAVDAYPASGKPK
ncbi:proB, partial [Symbiodinium natans]